MKYLFLLYDQPDGESPEPGFGRVDGDPGLFRAHWWGSVATVTRLAGGDLGLAEDAVPDACAAALGQWPEAGLPSNPRAWLVSVARNKARDRVRPERAFIHRRLGEVTATG